MLLLLDEQYKLALPHFLRIETLPFQYGGKKVGDIRLIMLEIFTRMLRERSESTTAV
jgi:hypothetical protein